MERLPVKFEEEVLEKHGIFYSECMERYENHEDFCVECGSSVSKYGIAGIALEAMKDKLKNKEWVEIGCCNLYDNHMWEISYENWHDRLLVIEDKDFCTCVFKAVREIWGDE